MSEKRCSTWVQFSLQTGGEALVMDVFSAFSSYILTLLGAKKVENEMSSPTHQLFLPSLKLCLLL